MSGSELAAGKPIIGLTTYLENVQSGHWDTPAAYLQATYLQSVTAAGGIAVLLPPQPVDPSIAARVLAGLDGLIITGGKDVEPARYGQDAHPLTDAPVRDRDAWEDALLGTAIESGLPFLAICRGVQLLNVHCGGTLIQHLPDVVGHDSYSGGANTFGTNTAAVQTGSRIAELLEGEVELPVQSHHHQALDAIGDGLAVTARGTDGVVQAVELAGSPFGIGVQWHPEQDDDLRLFAGLVDAAREHLAARDQLADQDARA